MKAIVRALLEIKKLVFFITVLTNFINSVIVFLVFCFIFIMLKIPGYYAVIPFLLHFMIYGRKRIKGINYRYVESRVPALRERLRTAADNWDKENEVVNSLNRDVLAEMKHVKTAAFLDDKGLVVKMLTISLLSIIIILSSAADFAIIGWKDAVKGIDNALSGGESIYQNLTEIEIYDEGDEDIFGKDSIAELGLDELDLKLDTAASGVNINKVKDTEEKEFGTVFPKDIYATSDSSYNEKISKENQEIVKKYYEQITGAD